MGDIGENGRGAIDEVVCMCVCACGVCMCACVVKRSGDGRQGRCHDGCGLGLGEIGKGWEGGCWLGGVY